MNQISKPICVVICIDKNYIKQGIVTIKSLVDSNKLEVITLYIATINLDTHEVKRIFEAIVLHHPACTIRICSLSEEYFIGLPTSSQFSLSIYSRIIFNRFVSPEFDRVLYLDSDIIVQCSLRPLWDENFEGSVICAVSDPFRLDLQEIGFTNSDLYFNSGVLLIDRVRWQQLECEQKVLNVLLKRADSLPWMDQDALNMVLRGMVKFVGLEWNFQPRCADVTAKFLSLSNKQFRTIRARPKIIHYTTSHKPWTAPFRVHYSKTYIRVANAAGWSLQWIGPKQTSDRLLAFKTQVRWYFPGAFRWIRRFAKPDAAARMYRSGPK